MKKYVLLILLASCVISYGQDQISDQEKITELKKELEQKNEKIKQLEDKIAKLADIKTQGTTKTKSTIVERLANLEVQFKEQQNEIKQHEAILKEQKGIIKITYIQNSPQNPLYGNSSHSHKGDHTVKSRTFKFVKKEENSVLRITYHDNFYIEEGRANWLIRINKDVKLSFSFYTRSISAASHKASSFVGYVEDLPIGEHTLDVEAKGSSKFDTGWPLNYFTLQVEEIAASIIENKSKVE